MSSTGGRILVVDDKDTMVSLWQRVLEPDHKVWTAASGEAAVAMLPTGEFDVVVSDIRMPGIDGFEVLRQVQKLSPGTEVVLVTAFATVEQAVDAMREGAYDFVTKPFDPDQARLRVERALERRRLRQKAEDLEAELHGAGSFGELVGGQSPATRRLFALLEKAARTELTVLLTGESGTGKELAARAIHAHGPRAGRAFVPVNCGAIPENLIESELFGHVKGAFTGADRDKAGLFESAQGGTLFLDEVSELPLAMQVKLNRVLQEGELRRVGDTQARKIDVRVIAATNVELKERVAQGRFREDVFYRLNVFPIVLPPLRDRREDLPALTGSLLAKFRRKAGSGATTLSAEALQALYRYRWPGNVRELENALQRAAAMADGPQVEVADLPAEVTAGAPASGSGATVGGSDPSILGLSFKEALSLAEDQAARRYLDALMTKFGGSVTKAAEVAGMARETLHRTLKRYGLDPADYRKGGSAD